MHEDTVDVLKFVCVQLMYSTLLCARDIDDNLDTCNYWAYLCLTSVYASPPDVAGAEPDSMDTGKGTLVASIKGQLLQGLSDDAEEIR